VMRLCKGQHFLEDAVTCQISPPVLVGLGPSLIGGWVPRAGTQNGYLGVVPGLGLLPMTAPRYSSCLPYLQPLQPIQPIQPIPCSTSYLGRPYHTLVLSPLSPCQCDTHPQHCHSSTPDFEPLSRHLQLLTPGRLARQPEPWSYPLTSTRYQSRSAFNIAQV